MLLFYSTSRLPWGIQMATVGDNTWLEDFSQIFHYKGIGGEINRFQFQDHPCTEL